ncbi:MAG: ribosome assembly factor SBDS [Candidatus Saliniplasma sp.]
MGKRDYQKEHTESLLDEYVIARYRSHGENFEILLDPDAVEKYRGGKEVDLLENMPAEKVFSDAKKGEEASHSLLDMVFDTNEIELLAEQILDKGEVQLTTEQRKQRQEQKEREIIDRIVRDSMNPQTNAPHPPKRIENAIKEANIHIDPFKPVSKQVEEIVDEIKTLLPMSFEKLTFSVKVRGDLYGKIYGVLKNVGNIIDEKWTDDGSWMCKIKLPAGAKDEFFEVVNEKTKGNVEIEKVD